MKSTFVGLDLDDVAALRSLDSVVGSICGLRKDGENISFQWLRARALAHRHRDIWSQLRRGTGILSSSEQLDQYLYSYGPMIAAQWESVTKTMSLPKSPVRLVDYGCGQGLAGLLLFDKFGHEFSSTLARVILIEPSAVALIRAEAVYRRIAPECEIFCVNKGFDDLGPADLMADIELDTVHIFSNVLDIGGFDQYRLFSQLVTKGRHSVYVVSTDRKSHGGTARIRDLRTAVEDPKHREELSITKSVLQDFTCGDGKYRAVSWQLEIEASGG